MKNTHRLLQILLVGLLVILPAAQGMAQYGCDVNGDGIDGMEDISPYFDYILGTLPALDSATREVDGGYGITMGDLCAQWAAMLYVLRGGPKCAGVAPYSYRISLEDSLFLPTYENIPTTADTFWVDFGIKFDDGGSDAALNWGYYLPLRIHPDSGGAHFRFQGSAQTDGMQHVAYSHNYGDTLVTFVFAQHTLEMRAKTAGVWINGRLRIPVVRIAPGASPLVLELMPTFRQLRMAVARDTVAGDISDEIGLLTPVVMKRNICCVGRVGNIDCDPADIVDVSDLTTLIDCLFLHPSDCGACCPGEANMDGDPAAGFDVSDVTALIDFLFIGFNLLPQCSGN